MQLGLNQPRGDFSAITTKLTADELVQSKRSANRREDYLKSLSYYLSVFIKGWEGRPINEITSAEIETRLEEIAGGQSDNSRQTWFNRVNTLFSFAKRRGYITENPVDRLERITVDRNDPIILTVEQSKLLLKTCPTVLRPYLILAMFAGIRPDGELMKMTWEHINLEAGTVAVNFPKVRKHRRVVKLEPIAIQLLKAHPIKKGNVAPSKSTVRRWKRKIRTMLGYERFPQDVFRHTAASFLLELHEDVAMVARMLGNSPHILLTHYAVPVSKTDCERFWKA
jgi:integrase